MAYKSRFTAFMNILSWIAAILAGAAAWVAAPRIGISVLGSDVVYLLCFLVAAWALYAVQLLKLAANLFRKSP